MPEKLASEYILAVNIPEACRRISVGETLLREMMADGRIPFSRLPGAKPHSRGRIVIRVTDLDKLLIATRVDVSRTPAFRDTAHEPRSRSKRTVEREPSVPMLSGKGTEPTESKGTC
jgi:hypothetical protein